MPIIAEAGINWDNACCTALRAEDVNSYWAQLEPFFTRWAGEGLGEMKAEDVRDRLISGLMNVLMFHAGGDIKLVVLSEFVQYPQLKVLRFVALIGEKPQVAKKFLPAIKDWARANGATQFEAICTPHATRYMEWIGLHKVYNVLRQDLEEN